MLLCHKSDPCQITTHPFLKHLAENNYRSREEFQLHHRNIMAKTPQPSPHIKEETKHM